ncbi:MAG TPA: YebC/PmpR family DNA-binding transcriptional regulator [Patescibacteria group bacterium]|nr:YebC/PmpR family DNA-binding transcriptional regulator [Patescibacteria group bacterium]
MSGHSKWATIKRAKGVADVKRGKVFSKLAREISTAARRGGSDPDSNPTLRSAIEKAHSYNMPKENIERAAASASSAQALEEAVYEGYGPMGTAFMVRILTDNKNRTLPEIRRIFENHGGKMGEAGSAAYVFIDPENPTFTVPVSDPETAKKVLALAEALDEQDDVQDVYSNFDIPDELIHQLTSI